MTAVGVTGHQRLPDEIVRYARERLSTELTAESALQGICSLAAGADQLFADVVLNCGGHLRVVVPCEGYESSFEGESERAAYRRLLASARSVETLDYASPSEEAFFAAGQRVVDLSEKLIAVWDGEAARGHGGTADVVEYASKQHKPIEVLWLQGISREQH